MSVVTSFPLLSVPPPVLGRFLVSDGAASPLVVEEEEGEVGDFGGGVRPRPASNSEVVVDFNILVYYDHYSVLHDILSNRIVISLF